MTPGEDADARGDACWLSVVVPCYDEEGSLPHLCERLAEVLVPLTHERGRAFEVVFVDDGSQDATWSIIQDLCATHGWARGLKFARNFGHQAAIQAGMSAARGEAVITMDADLQHPPELLPELIARWEQGARVVLTRRLTAPDTSAFKRSTSYLFYKLFSLLTEVQITPGSSDFRLLSRRALEYVLRVQDASLFFRGAVAWMAYDDTAIVEFRAAERYAGETGYTFKKMWSMASQSMLSFSNRPLKLAMWLGALMSVLSFVELGYILWMYIQGTTVAGWASTLGLVSLLFGIMFILLGIIGLYIANIYTILQNRPHYLLSEDTDWHDATAH
jgi:dolichol-phosphate mannosyltransferase